MCAPRLLPRDNLKAKSPWRHDWPTLRRGWSEAKGPGTPSAPARAKAASCARPRGRQVDPHRVRFVPAARHSMEPQTDQRATVIGPEPLSPRYPKVSPRWKLEAKRFLAAATTRGLTHPSEEAAALSVGFWVVRQDPEQPCGPSRMRREDSGVTTRAPPATSSARV